jgi:hypothetical protein
MMLGIPGSLIRLYAGQNKSHLTYAVRKFASEKHGQTEVFLKRNIRLKNGGIQMATLAVVTLWRCHCGANIKVFGEAEVANPRASQVVACPKCGQKQLVYVDRIVSINLGTTDLLAHDPATAP